MKLRTDTFKGLLIHLCIVIGLLFLLSFTFFYKVLPFATNKDDVITVPDLQGMTLDQAIRFLETQDLGYEVTNSSYNSQFPPLTVLKQFPRPFDKVKINRKINLKLNAKNPPYIDYPDLTGSTLDFAKTQLKALDLKVGTILYRPDIAHDIILESKVHGEIIRMRQRIPKGTEIDLVVGANAEQFVLPDFRNMILDKAESQILGMALKIREVHSVNDDTKEPNTVAKQQPLPEDTVRRGGIIELWVFNLKKDE